MNHGKTFTISELIEVAEKVYKHHGDLTIMIRMDKDKGAPVREVGVASGLDAENKEQRFLCLSTFVKLPD